MNTTHDRRELPPPLRPLPGFREDDPRQDVALAASIPGTTANSFRGFNLGEDSSILSDKLVASPQNFSNRLVKPPSLSLRFCLSPGLTAEEKNKPQKEVAPAIFGIPDLCLARILLKSWTKMWMWFLPNKRICLTEFRSPRNSNQCRY